jgi:hypothetical protein
MVMKEAIDIELFFTDKGACPFEDWLKRSTRG